jgi:hypothetical protein
MPDDQTNQESSERSIQTRPWMRTILEVTRAKPPRLNFSDPEGKVWLEIGLGEEPFLRVAPGLSQDTAAKRFWNACCKVAGQLPMFPEEGA